MRVADQQCLQTEYQRLVDGLIETNASRQSDELLANPGRHLVVFYLMIIPPIHRKFLIVFQCSGNPNYGTLRQKIS